MCSGKLDSVARRLAARAAVANAAGKLGDAGHPLTGSEVAELDLVYMEFCERSASVDAIEREVDRHRLDWTAVEWRSQGAVDLDVVREAALCIRDDGRDFEEVADAAGLAVERRRTDVVDVDTELAAHLLGARVGELLGPLPVGNEYWLVEVLDKRVPTSEDPEVRAVARDAVVGRAVEGQVVDRGKRGENDEEVPLNRLGPGDAFGEVALLEGGARTATVRASSEVEALRLDRSVFAALERGNPEIRAEFELQVRHDRLRDFLRIQSVFARLPATAALAQLIGELRSRKLVAGSS